MLRSLSVVLAALVLAVLPAQSGTAIGARTAPEAVLAGTATTAAGSAYAFSSLLDGKPIRWNPCQAIHWQFRPQGAPVGGLTVVRSAVARIAQATGTTWVYEGQVSTVPSTSWLPSTAKTARPLLIGWGDGATSDLLRSRPAAVLGVTRTAWFGVQSGGVKYAAIRAGVIALDRTDRLPLTGPLSWRTVLLHELAHAMGLDHAGSSAQLMYPMLSRTFTDLRAGDLEGLRRVGRSAGCVVVPGY